MSRATMSDHLALEIEAAHRLGRPLEAGQPVPRCGCEDCTGVPADHPLRTPAWRRASPARAARSDADRRREWERRVEAARRIPVVDIARLLGCGEPVKRGRELHVRCPLHQDSDPSCRLNVSAGVWYCDPCAAGGDAIDLYARARRLTFADAVRELVAA